MNQLKEERTFGELGSKNRCIFIVSEYWKPLYTEICHSLFGNTVLTTDKKSHSFSGLLATDPAGCLFFGHDDARGAQKLQRKKEELLSGFNETGSYENLLICVHASRKRFQRDALEILERAEKIFSPTNQLLVVDSETHAQQNWQMEPEGVIAFLDRVNARKSIVSPSVLNLGTERGEKARMMIKKKIREMLIPS